jgi:hypothetical protein
MLELHLGRNDTVELVTPHGVVEIRIDRIGVTRIDLSIDAPREIRIDRVPAAAEARR